MSKKHKKQEALRELSTILNNHQTKCIVPDLSILYSIKENSFDISLTEDYVSLEELESYFYEIFKLLYIIKEYNNKEEV